MNTAVRVVADDADLEPWFRQVEQTLTRFDPESPLSQLNRMPGRWVVAPPLLYRAVAAAIRAASDTGGPFDPTVLDALEAAGYSRSFEAGQTPPGAPIPAGRWAEIRLAPEMKAIWLPHGVRLDLGGIGKGLAVDGALYRLRRLPRALVDAGGDIALRTAPGDPPALVAVADPFRPDRTLATFGLCHGAAATSSTLGRRWGAGLHHIIDPATGRPADSGIVAATVFAGKAVRAEVLAKACIVLGPQRGMALLKRAGAHGLLVLADGQTILTPGMEEYRYASA